MEIEQEGATAHHQQHISSLVVRPSISDDEGSHGGGSSEYESKEVRREPLPNYRSHRCEEDAGYKIHRISRSPSGRRDVGRCYSSDFDRPVNLPRGLHFGSRRERSGYRDFSPPSVRGMAAVQLFERGLEGPKRNLEPYRVNGPRRNNPNIRPREGDWICPDPVCGNLNFARRDYCNSCKRYRFAAEGSPTCWDHLSPTAPPFYPPARHLPGPPIGLPPERPLSTFRSPPREWVREGFRDFVPDGPIPMKSPMWGERFDHPEHGYRVRPRFQRIGPADWEQVSNVRNEIFRDGRLYERRPLTPPPRRILGPPSHCDGWGMRERSRSPVRDDRLKRNDRPMRDGPPMRDYYERGVNGRRGRGRPAFHRIS